MERPAARPGRRSVPTAAASLEAREQEARRIARDLHDEAGQMLAAAHLALDELTGCIPEEQRGHVERARQALCAAEEGLRRIAHDLRPMVLDDLGLRAALEQLAAQTTQRHGVPTRARVDVVTRLPAAMEAHLYRIAQEAVANAVRHGRARRIEIHLGLAGDALALTVEDDGHGGLATNAHRCGLGLRGMRERAELLGGRLVVEAVPGRGATVIAVVPLPVEPWPPYAS